MVAVTERWSVSRITQFVRFVLALIAFVVLLSPFATVFTPPDPFTQIIALAVGAVVAVPVAGVFVRQSRSLERLYRYVLAMYVLTFVVGIAFAGIGYLFEASIGLGSSQSSLVWVAEQVLFLFVVYALAFHLVYRGGYARLKARFA